MANNSIKVKNYSNVFEEYDAVAAITPGMLIELTSAGEVQAHSTAAGNALPMFALENELEGEGIGDAYAEDDKVSCWIPGRGDQVLGILADEQDVAIGDFLESAGDGYLQKHVSDEASAGEAIPSNVVVGIALEAIDLSGSSGEESENADLDYNKRIKVRII